MEKIASFTVNHLTLRPGVYVSRKDHVGAEVVTTFDLRMTAPNLEPVLNTAEVHSIEHLGATYLRNHPEICSFPCSASSATMRARSRERLQETAVITLI